MATQKVPKVVLFDIGGVVVVSPFRAILRYEQTNNLPTGWINTAISLAAPQGAWQRLERGEVPLDDAWFNLWGGDIASPRPDAWKSYYLKANPGKSESEVPPPPKVDTKKLFWEMISEARCPDPNVYPMLCALREWRQERKKRGESEVVIAALSNAVIFPEGIKTHRGEEFDSRLQFTNGVDIRTDAVAEGSDPRSLASYFDIFLHSAHIKMRKPEPRIYQHAVKVLDELVRGKGGASVRADDVVFLDDIGSNLREARAQGIRTIKVKLGKTEEAVKELEDLLGADLSGKKTGSKL